MFTGSLTRLDAVQAYDTTQQVAPTDGWYVHSGQHAVPKAQAVS